jgi:hypothetical protein
LQTKKILIHDILGLMVQSKTTGRCGFPLANPHSAESLHYGPQIESLVPLGIIVYLFRQHTINPRFFGLNHNFFLSDLNKVMAGKKEF